MATSPPSAPDVGSREHTYSRKQKFCSASVQESRDGGSMIIVNVLESVGVLSRKGKNQYTWKGFKGIPKALAALKEEGLRENFGSSDGSSRTKVLEFDEDTDFNSDTGSQPKPSNPNVTKSSRPSKSG